MLEVLPLEISCLYWNIFSRANTVPLSSFRVVRASNPSRFANVNIAEYKKTKIEMLPILKEMREKLCCQLSSYIILLRYCGAIFAIIIKAYAVQGPGGSISIA